MKDTTQIKQILLFHIQCILISHFTTILIYNLPYYFSLSISGSIMHIIVSLVAVIGINLLLVKRVNYHNIPIIWSLLIGIIILTIIFVIGDATSWYLWGNIEITDGLRVPFYFVFIPDSLTILFVIAADLTAVCLQYVKDRKWTNKNK